MKINILQDESSAQLIPENEREQQDCWKLINTKELNGWGSDQSGKILHVEIPLFPIGTVACREKAEFIPLSDGSPFADWMAGFEKEEIFRRLGVPSSVLRESQCRESGPIDGAAFPVDGIKNSRSIDGLPPSGGNDVRM